MLSRRSPSLGPGLVVALAVAVLAAGCASGLSTSQLQEWVGRPAAKLAESWGPPTREVTDEGKRVLIYEELDAASRQSFAGAQTRETRDNQMQSRYMSSYRGPQIYARSYLFWVDDTGAIVRAERRQP